MSLRILQVMNRVPWPLKDGGSIGYYNYTLGYHLAGCKVTVAALNTSKHHVQTLPDELTQIAKWITTDVDTSINPIDAFLHLFRKGSYQVSRFYHTAFTNQLLQLVQSETFDVIVFESVFMAPYLSIIKPHTKALMVLREHNIEFEIWKTLAARESNPLRKWYLGHLAQRMEQFEKATINRFDVLTTVTPDDAKQLKQMGCTKPVFVSPAGVNCQKFKLVKEVESSLRKIFFIGSLEWMPNKEGVEWFCKKVWPLIKDEYQLENCAIAGRNMPAYLKQFGDDKLSMIGEVEDAVSFMQDKQVMIVPLFSGSGIRVKILEGMAMGKTIICTTLACQGIECDNGVHLLIANTPEEFAEAIKRCLNDEKLCRQIGTQARRLVEEKYENTKVIEHIIDFYKHEIGISI